MIPGRAELAAALWGAFRLARFDASGLSAYGRDGNAAWRSFFAAAVLAPAYFLWFLFNGDFSETGLTLGRLMYEGWVYVGSWLLFPVFAWYLIDNLGRAARFPHYLCAYNWIAVVQNVLFMAIDMALTGAGTSQGAQAFFGLVLLVYVLGLSWFVARHALDLVPAAAALVVALDVTLALVWESFTEGLIGGT